MGIKDFSLDIPKQGHIMAVRYERRKKFAIFSEGIYQKQLWEGFNSDDALYTHVAISSGGPHLVNVMPPKAKLIDIHRVYTGVYVKFLRFKGLDFDNPIRYKIACMYNAIASNLKYDWRGALHFIIPRIKQSNDRPFCSEVSCIAYQMQYPYFLNCIKSAECMPAHFLNKAFFETVWEGFIE